MAALGPPVVDVEVEVEACAPVAGPAGVAPPNVPSLAGTM
jgi:hypothetical protein